MDPRGSQKENYRRLLSKYERIMPRKKKKQFGAEKVPEQDSDKLRDLKISVRTEKINETEIGEVLKEGTDVMQKLKTVHPGSKKVQQSTSQVHPGSSKVNLGTNKMHLGTRKVHQSTNKVHHSYLRSWWFFIFLIFVASDRIESVSARKKIDVYVAGFFPLAPGSPKSDLGKGVMPALDLGVKHVNDHPTILRNYKLHVVWNDTQCNTAIATKAFFDMMFKDPPKVMLFGAACTLVTDPIAKASKHWHITQLSYADTHPMFSAKKYPNFFRMVPSEKEFNQPRLQLLEKFNWKRIGTLYQNEPRHALSHNHLLSLLDSAEFEIAEVQSFADELQDQLTKLVEKDVRIILGNFDEDWARKIFCEAYKKKMYGKNYQWIITGMYREKWWSLDNIDGSDDLPDITTSTMSSTTTSSTTPFNISTTDLPTTESGEPFSTSPYSSTTNPYNLDKNGGCAVENIMTALEGCIMTDLLPLASHERKTVSGKNVTQYETEYNALRGHEYSRFHAYTYDGVWSLALAIQAVGHKLHRMNHKNKTYRTVQDFRYRDPKWESLFREALSEVKFEGVTGPVQFTSDNTREGYILLKQFQGGREVAIGEYDGFEHELHLDENHPIYWHGEGPALDRTIRIIEKNTVNMHFYVALVTICSIGIITASIFLAINLRYRNHRYIKMSSPYLNNLIICGCILTYTSVILLGLDSELTSEATFPYVCTARAWVLMAGFTLAFGSMFSKTWRVHSIFTNVQVNKKVIKDYQLFIVVFVLLFVDIAIMTTWQIVDPFFRHTKKMPSYKREDKEVIPLNEYCKSHKISIFVGCIYAYKGLLMICGCFLAWETRNVDIPALNDSKYIGMSVYNVVIMCVIGVPISYILSDDQDASYIIISIFIIFCTTGTLCLVFVPKLVELKRNPSGVIDKRVAARSTLKPPRRKESDSDVSDLHEQIKKAEGDRQVFLKKMRETEEEMKLLVLQYGGESPSPPTEKKGVPLSNESTTTVTATPQSTVVSPDVSSGVSVTKTNGFNTTNNNWQNESKPQPEITTDLNSICSVEAGTTEYVTSALPPSTNITSTTSIHHTQHNQTILSTSNLPNPSSPTKLNNDLAPKPPEDLDVESAMRRVPPYSSGPSTHHRDISKSVSFRLESGAPNSCKSPTESTLLTRSAPLGAATHAPPTHSPQQSPPALPPRRIPPPHESMGVLPHSKFSNTPYSQDYNTVATDMQMNSTMYAPDYGNREPLYQPRVNTSMDQIIPPYGAPVVHPVHDAAIQHYDQKFPHPLPRHSQGMDRRNINLHGIIDGTVSPDPYSHAIPPAASVRSGYNVPLNNEDDRAGMMIARRPPDLTIINNTMAGPIVLNKDSNIRANMGPPPLAIPRSSNTSRRASEPPPPLHMNPAYYNTRGREDESEFSQDYASRMRHDDRDPSRSISRARLRRDSFGEVVSRRSPSQDSITVMRATGRISPTMEKGSHAYDESRERIAPAHDTWSVTGPSSRGSPTHGSPEHQWANPSDRGASEESLATMSSRGSIYSVTSSRSDAPRHFKMNSLIRGGAQPHLPPFILNGELSDGVASSDDVNKPNGGPTTFREPSGLHRTSSEPYNNFEHLELENRLADPMFLLEQQRQLEGRGGTIGGTLPRHHQYHDSSGDLRGGRSRTSDGFGVVGFTNSLRGRSLARPRATTSSIAAALMATKARNASDNALDHNTSILPIFQKLLIERQGSCHTGRMTTMSSCPNITIKCDIVEYL